MKLLDTFSGDRKKFKAYEAQCRLYLQTDVKKGDWRNLKTIMKQATYITLSLREEAFTRLESYLAYLIKKGYANSEAEV